MVSRHRCGPLVHGAVVTHVLAPVDVDGDGPRGCVLERTDAADGRRRCRASTRPGPCAAWTLDRGPWSAPTGSLDGAPPGTVRDLALVVLSAEAVGGARWCVDTAAEHARTREQFGRPIGQFQGVKHRRGQHAGRRWSRAVAATWDAAMVLEAERRRRRPARRPTRRSLAVQLAAALALDGYVEAAKGAIQVLGGMGFTWEHDAHIHLRRATTLRQLVGGTAPLRAESARLALAGWRRRLTIDLPPEAEALRAELDAAGGRDRRHRGPGRPAAGPWPTSGLLAPHWPAPWGRDAGAVEQLVIDQVVRRGRAHAAQPGRGRLGPAHDHGPRHPRADRAVRRARPCGASIIWCQLFSEPGAGSDLAALTTRATRVDGGWSLTGQKVWTSVAASGPLGHLPGPDRSRTCPKHRGITYFLVDMHSPGIEVRPLREITGAALFNEVFFDDCFVPDECVVGEVDGGWKLARTTLANERVSLSTDSAFGGALEGVLARVAARPDLPGPGDPRPARPPAGRGPVAGPARDAGHPALGGRAPARLRSRACASWWAPSSTSGSTSSASTCAGPTARSPTGDAAVSAYMVLQSQVHDHRRGDQRGPAQRDRRAPARPAPRPRAGPVTDRRTVRRRTPASTGHAGAGVVHRDRVRAGSAGCRRTAWHGMETDRPRPGTRWWPHEARRAEEEGRDMADAVLYFEDVAEGDEAPGADPRADPHRPGGLRRGVGGLQPDAPRRGQGHGGRPAERVRPRHVLDGTARARPSPTRSASATSPGSPCGSPARPGPTRSCARRSW